MPWYLGDSPKRGQRGKEERGKRTNESNHMARDAHWVVAFGCSSLASAQTTEIPPPADSPVPMAVYYKVPPENDRNG